MYTFVLACEREQVFSGPESGSQGVQAHRFLKTVPYILFLKRTNYTYFDLVCLLFIKYMAIKRGGI